MQTKDNLSGEMRRLFPGKERTKERKKEKKEKERKKRKN